MLENQKNTHNGERMKDIEINGIKETIVERSDYPIEECKNILGNEVTAILGYGPQGRGQGLNMRDQGFKVILGLRKGRSWDKALADGWVEGETLFETEEAAQRGTILQYLLSDAGQIAAWPMVKANLNDGDALYFSHGFGIVFHEDTSIIPPENVDVILVAPKGSGLTVRTHFQAGRGINASFAIHQDYTGRARERCISTAFAIGSGHLFETTFKKEVHSDLTGERCVLMGLLQGAFLAQYEVLREHGHSPSKPTMKQLKKHCKVYILWLLKKAWTGCMLTARLLLNVEHLTGHRVFVMQ